MERKIIFSIIIAVILAAGLGIFLYLSSQRQEAVVLRNETATESADKNQSGVDAEAISGNDAGVKNDVSEKAENNSGGSSVYTGKGQAKSAVVRQLVDFGFQAASGRTIDTIIIHSSYDALNATPYDVSGLIAEYKSYGVSSHYLIDRQGNIYQLVEDKNIAYHAGDAKTPDGRSNVNSFSIGIELMNEKNDKYTDAQYAALDSLLKTLKGRFKIKYVLGHNQIAPGRKDDPWNFDWNRVK